jgi:hypothetical protein
VTDTAVRSNILKDKGVVTEDTTTKSKILSSLFESGGNINVALDKAGYAKTSRSMVLKTLSDEILEAAKTEMAAHSVTAIHRVVEGMNDVGEHPRAELRLKAAQTLLDRVGLGKQEKVEIEGKLLHGVVLMPSKKAMPTVTINEE